MMRLPASIKTPLLILPALLCSFAALSVLDTEEAHADVLLGVDLNGGVQLGEVNTDGLGLGANLRVGWQEDFIPVLRIAPELSLGYMGFAIDEVSSSGVMTAGSARQKMLMAKAGARVGVELGIGVSAYAHVGYGQAAVESVKQNGLAFDGGLALDFTALPFISFGLHGGYNALFPGSDPEADPINWVDFGVHAELVF